MATNGIPIHWGIGRHGPGNDVFLMVKDPGVRGGRGR